MLTPTHILQSILNDRKGYPLEAFIRLSMNLASRENVDLTARDKEGHTLLDHLIITNVEGANNQTIEKLLQLNQELINLPDENGRIPLHSLLMVSSEVSYDVIQQFIDWGSDIHHRDNNGESLLDACCFSGNLEAAKFLCNEGLNIKARSTLGNTLLHSAVHCENQALWEWLKTSGVDIAAKNEAGETVLNLAEHHNESMKNWLLENGAEQQFSLNDPTPNSDPCLSPNCMLILGGFITVLGVAAVALAFTVCLTLTAAPLLATVGVVSALVGLGLFATGAINKQSWGNTVRVAELDNGLHP